MARDTQSVVQQIDISQSLSSGVSALSKFGEAYVVQSELKYSFARISDLSESDDTTFDLTQDPQHEEFEQWCQNFVLADCNEQIVQVLADDVSTRALYDKLGLNLLFLSQKSYFVVPSEIDSVIFWKRYFFQQHLVDEEKKLKEALHKRLIFSWDLS